MQNTLRYLFIGILFPLLVQYVFYYEFTTNYTTTAFSEQGFREIYDAKVYKSRQLGKQLHLWVYHSIASSGAARKIQQLASDEKNPLSTRRLTIMDPKADPVFYMTYFLIAAFFTVLTALLMLLTFEDRTLFPEMGNRKDLVTCLLVLLIGFTQFVVTPYDTISYFFEAAGILLFLKYFSTRKPAFLVGVLAVIALSTFNRESSLLIVSFMAAVYFAAYGPKPAFIKALILPALAFAIPYLYLKLAQGGGAAFTDESKLMVNLDIRNSYALRGLAFGAFVLYLTMVTLNKNKAPYIKYFLIFALPYLVIVHMVGVMIEYRLWMPVLQGAFVLAFLKTKHSREEDTERQLTISAQKRVAL